MNVRLNLSGFFIEFNGRVIASESMKGTDEEKLKRAEEVINHINEIGLDNYIKSITQPPEPTLEDKVAELQDNQLVMMDAMATSYEKNNEISDNQLMIMDAIATLFEMQAQ